jgi:hypothetical protein
MVEREYSREGGKRYFEMEGRNGIEIDVYVYTYVLAWVFEEFQRGPHRRLSEREHLGNESISNLYRGMTS